jgi:RNA polymerase sigma-70 factor (ECF subfamily)
MGLDANGVVACLLRHRLRLVAAAVSVVRNPHDADDVFQQVVLSALRSTTPFNDPAHLLAWATRAARHRALDVARRKHLCSLSDQVLDLLEAEWGDPAGPGRSDAADALGQCMEHLAPAAQNVLRMKYFDGLSVQAIADRVRRTTDAVYQLLSRSQRGLRGCVEQRLATMNKPMTEGIA